MAVPGWTQLHSDCSASSLAPTDSELASGVLSAAASTPSSPITFAVSSLAEAAGKHEKRCEDGPLSSSALRELQGLLDGLDPASPSTSTFLLSVLSVFKLAPPYLAAHALSMGGDAGNWQVVDALMQLHKRARNLSSMPSQLVVAITAFLASSCEAAGLPNDPLSSRPAVGEVLISHLVYLASRVEELHTPRGLATTARALRTLFALSTSGSNPGRGLAQLCQMADVPGRVIQALAHDTTQLLPSSEAPSSLDDPQQQQLQEVVELYVQLLSAGVTYLGVSSGMFHAPGGRRVLDAASQRSSRAWLLVPGRLAALRRPLQDASALALGQQVGGAAGPVRTWLKPEYRTMACSALRNLLMTLALPLCSSRSQDDVVELMEFCMRFSHVLYESGYQGLLSSLGSTAGSALGTSDIEEQKVAKFASAACGSLSRAVAVIGGQFNAWGVQLQRPASLAANGPEFGCDLAFAADSKKGVSADTAKAFIEEQIPLMLDMSNQLLAAVQGANA